MEFRGPSAKERAAEDGRDWAAKRPRTPALAGFCGAAVRPPRRFPPTPARGCTCRGLAPALGRRRCWVLSPACPGVGLGRGPAGAGEIGVGRLANFARPPRGPGPPAPGPSPSWGAEAPPLGFNRGVHRLPGACGPGPPRVLGAYGTGARRSQGDLYRALRTPTRSPKSRAGGPLSACKLPVPGERPGCKGVAVRPRQRRGRYAAPDCSAYRRSETPANAG